MIFATILEQNGHPYEDCLSNLPVKALPFGADLRVTQEVWMTPVTDGGVFRGYKRTAWLSGSTAPTVDSFRASWVTDAKTGWVYLVAATAANLYGAADAATVSPETIPVPVPAYAPCVDASGNYTYIFGFPTKASGDEYKVYVTVDGVQAVPAASAGHASIALAVTWLNTNYSSAGTWSNPSGNILKLVNTTGKGVGVTITVGNYA